MTRGLRSWQYGYFEMRGRIDTSAGLWPAWWTLGTIGRWPHNGEIDIMEYYRSTLLANVAWGGPSGRPIWDDVRKAIGSFRDPDWATKFHVWRMLWDERSIRLSVDDIWMNDVDVERTVNQDGGGVNPLRQAHYMLANLAVRHQRRRSVVTAFKSDTKSTHPRVSSSEFWYSEIARHDLSWDL
jgi:beta-glucanase (GH16 family)